MKKIVRIAISNSLVQRRSSRTKVTGILVTTVNVAEDWHERLSGLRKVSPDTLKTRTQVRSAGMWIGRLD